MASAGRVGDGHLTRLTARVLFLAVVTAAEIIATPSISPIAAPKRWEAFSGASGVALTVGSLLALASLALGPSLFSILLTAMLPFVLTVLAEFVSITVPPHPEMVVALVAIPVIYGHALYVLAREELDDQPLSTEQIGRLHPWVRSVVLRLRRTTQSGRAAPLARRWLAADERSWWVRTFTVLMCTAVTTCLAGVLVRGLAVFNSSPRSGIPAGSRIAFLVTALVTLLAAPAVAFLAVRAEFDDRMASQPATSAPEVAPHS
jgi:hypothetical protein